MILIWIQNLTKKKDKSILLKNNSYVYLNKMMILIAILDFDYFIYFS